MLDDQSEAAEADSALKNKHGNVDTVENDWALYPRTRETIPLSLTKVGGRIT